MIDRKNVRFYLRPGYSAKEKLACELLNAIPAGGQSEKIREWAMAGLALHLVNAGIPAYLNHTLDHSMDPAHIATCLDLLLTAEKRVGKIPMELDSDTAGTTVASNGTTVASPEAGTSVAPNGTTVASKAESGTTVAPNGTSVASNGTSVASNGTTVASPEAGTTVAPPESGTTVAPNGTTVASNGTSVAPNDVGTTVAPNGTTVASPEAGTTVASPGPVAQTKEERFLELQRNAAKIYGDA